MWSYKIVSKDSSGTQKPTSTKGASSLITYDAVKQRILQKQLKRNSFKAGDIIQMQNGHRGSILEVIYDYDEVQWFKSVPYFLLIKDHQENAEYIAHPSIIKRVK